MDLEGFARRKILEGRDKGEIIKEISDLVGEFKKWESEKKGLFSEAIYEDVSSALDYKKLQDQTLKELLDYPKSRVTMGEFGVGSRGEGDFKVHRSIADIIGEKGVLIGPQDQDDAGVVKGGGNYVTVAVDGIHSRLSEFPFLAGFHAARAAMRDVYVMGSKPVALISDLHLADDGDVGKLFDFTAGVSTVGDLCRVPLVSGSTLRVGGDMVFGDRLVAAVGCVGVSSSRPLARRYAEEGDIILLTQGKGGGTIATTAIFSSNFDVIKETLNIDFMRAMEAIFKDNVKDQIHTMTDVTNGGLRGDALEISKTSGKRLVFFEEELKKSVSEPVYQMLEEQEIDYMGISTDSLMIILPEKRSQRVKNVLKKASPVLEVGYVENGRGAGIVRDKGEEELKPFFRESAYTKVKKVVGESSPKNLKKLSKKIDSAKEEAVNKKRDVLEWIAKE
jgi:hydrogenase expression/formation protein